MGSIHLGLPELLVILVVALLIFGPKKFNFPRGPRPHHPIPADDAVLLTRKRSRKNQVSL